MSIPLEAVTLVRMAQIVVLIHLSRSGSTLLSRLLDELDEVGVTIEGAVPDGMTIPWIEITDAPSLDRALDALFAQWKFSHWGVNRDALRERLIGSGYPVHFRAWLTAILDCYFSARPGLKAQVYKRGAYADHLDDLHERIPNAKVIAIVRDPRGAYCSQIRRGSTLGPAWFAKSYNRSISCGTRISPHGRKRRSRALRRLSAPTPPANAPATMSARSPPARRICTTAFPAPSTQRSRMNGARGWGRCRRPASNICVGTP
jgi:hypothetical protein